MPSIRNRARRLSFALVAAAPLVACGPKEPPRAPDAPAPKPLDVAPEAPVELSPVPEPSGIVGLVRVSSPEATSQRFGAWAGVAIPTARDAIHEVVGGELGALVDTSAPVDAVARFAGSSRAPSIAYVVSVPLVSLDAARSFVAKYKLSPLPNGMTKVEGLLPAEGEEENPHVCVLGPSAGKAKGRIVCGDQKGVEALAPYALRTLAARPVAPNDPDVRVELRAAPLHEGVQAMRMLLPALVGGFIEGKNGVGGATREIVEATVGDVADFAVDSRLLTVELFAAPEGALAELRYAFGSNKATLTRAMVFGADRVGPPPATFLRLPADADAGGWARPTEKGLFDRPRKLLAALLEESFEGDLPAAERHALVDGFVGHTLPLLEGGFSFAHGFDLDATRDKVAAMARDSAAEDVATKKAQETRKKAAFEQLAGYTIVHLEAAPAEVGKVVKDWAALVTKLAQAKKKKNAPTIRTTAVPGGLSLPPKTVHAELVIPRDAVPDAKGKAAFTPAPYVCHVLVVPGEGTEASTSWIGLGCDTKLVAQKLLASRALVPSGPTLGTRPESKGLVASSSRSGFFFTPRLLGWAKLVDHEPSAVGSLGADGPATAYATTTPEPASKDAPGGSVKSTIVVPKAAMGASAGVMLH